MSKKIISTLLICCFLVSSVFAVNVSAAEADIPAWNFDATGQLTINSASVLEDYTSAQDVPWNLFVSLVTTVSIDPEISYIGAYSLNNLNATVQIDNGNTTIAEHAFDNAGENFVIVSVFNSPVHTYAKEHGLAFEAISVASGTCGENANWNIYPDGTLHISGSGAMTDYYRNPTSTPWYSYASTITSVLVDEGITSVSPYTVFSADACMSATILGADTQVSSVAFQMVHADFVIYGHLNSSAQSVAEARGYRFEPFIIDSGSCGKNVTWTLYTTGLLKIDGYGEMTSYKNPNNLPYFDYDKQITTIEIGEGITQLSNYTWFITYSNCKTFTVWNPSVTFSSYTITPITASTELEICGYGGSTAQAYAEQKSLSFAPCSPLLAMGTCGTDTSWQLHENGVLRIYGTGAVDSYPKSKAPWYNFRDLIQKIDISESVTNVIDYTYFDSCNCSALIIRNPSALINSYAVFAQQSNLIIYGDFGSTAETYANSRGIAFASLIILGTGSCGTNVTWTLYTNGYLEITGSGAMNNYTIPEAVPWYNYNQLITSIEIDSGVTSISSFTSFNQKNCTSITVLNRNATFGSPAIAIQRNDLILYGYTGSTTQTYAESKSITFNALD